MDIEMKVNAALVRQLREAKAWSQEHLATAAGLSPRTVQRVEAEGVGSAETRLALAAALEVPVSRLSPTMTVQSLTGRRLGRALGWAGWGVGAAGAVAGIAVGIHGGMTAEQAGVVISIVCTGLGFSAAAIGFIGRWARTQPETA